MKKQEKIAKYMAKGLTKEQAEKLIPYGQNDYLTLEELAVKYDNPSLLSGEYPDWLTPEDHFRLCCVVAATKYDTKKFKWFYMSKEDLEIDLFIYTTIRLPKIKNYAMLKTALCNRVKNILRDNIQKETICVKEENATDEQLNQYKYFDRINGDKYIIGSLDNYIVDENTGEFSDLVQSDYDESMATKLETIETIRNIKNKQVRQILVVCGYLLSDLDELYVDYRQVLQQCSKRVKQNLHKLCEKQLMYEDYKVGKYKTTDTRRMRPITIADIVAAFDLKEQLSNICTDTTNINKLESVTKTFNKNKSQNSLKQKLILQKKLVQSIIKDIKYYLVENHLFGNLNLL